MRECWIWRLLAAVCLVPPGCERPLRTAADRTLVPPDTHHPISLAWNPSTKTPLVGCTDGRLLVWEESNLPPRVLETGSSFPVTTLALLPDGSLIAGTADGRLYAASLTGARERRFDPQGAAIRAIALHPQAERTLQFALALADGRLVFADAHGSQSVASHHKGGARCALYAPTGDTLVTAGDDGRLAWWSVSTLRRSAVADGHRTVVAATLAGQRTLVGQRRLGWARVAVGFGSARDHGRGRAVRRGRGHRRAIGDRIRHRKLGRSVAAVARGIGRDRPAGTAYGRATRDGSRDRTHRDQFRRQVRGLAGRPTGRSMVESGAAGRNVVWRCGLHRLAPGPHSRPDAMPSNGEGFVRPCTVARPLNGRDVRCPVTRRCVPRRRPRRYNRATSRTHHPSEVSPMPSAERGTAPRAGALHCRCGRPLTHRDVPAAAGNRKREG